MSDIPVCQAALCGHNPNRMRASDGLCVEPGCNCKHGEPARGDLELLSEGEIAPLCNLARTDSITVAMCGVHHRPWMMCQIDIAKHYLAAIVGGAFSENYMSQPVGALAKAAEGQFKTLHDGLHDAKATIDALRRQVAVQADEINQRATTEVRLGMDLTKAREMAQGWREDRNRALGELRDLKARALDEEAIKEIGSLIVQRIDFDESRTGAREVARRTIREFIARRGAK